MAADEPAEEEERVSAEAGGLERAEDAVVPRPAPSPYSPSKAEREAHEATHLPFRSWCSACVQGRADNPPHRRLPARPGDEQRLPEVHIDYAFLRRVGSESLAKLVVMKVHPSRAVRAWVVPSKGTGEISSAERVVRGIREAGIRTPCVLKCDGEPSAEALREEVMRRLGDGAVPQSPPVGESESNGVVENGAKVYVVYWHFLATPSPSLPVPNCFTIFR